MMLLSNLDSTACVGWKWWYREQFLSSTSYTVQYSLVFSNKKKLRYDEVLLQIEFDCFNNSINTQGTNHDHTLNTHCCKTCKALTEPNPWQGDDEEVITIT